MYNFSDGYLVICSYTIAILDFVSALLFACVSGALFFEYNHWTSLAALIFSLLWMLIVLMLFLGIYQRNLVYVRYWLVFTCLGIMLDSLLLLYGLSLAVSINWDRVKITILPFVGLAVEMTFVYIIYLFYVDMIDTYRPVTHRQSGGSEVEPNAETSSIDTKSRERMRLKKMFNRDKKAALRELERKLLRGQV